MINLELLDIKLRELEEEFKKYDRPSLTWCIKVLFSKLFEGDNDCYRYANGIQDLEYKSIDGDHEFIYDLVVLREEKSNTNFTKRILSQIHY